MKYRRLGVGQAWSSYDTRMQQLVKAISGYDVSRWRSVCFTDVRVKRRVKTVA